ncbi:germinal center-associated signaling and motility protein [Petaurus breviceps papuanus]|uniref:germinal center-associated signaling and motility protein n=1 Tax=Petaurus breviceps papuanus TaxID=3040969 RepID=UPI0036DE3368
MKREVKPGAGLTNPNEKMGNCLQRRLSWPKKTREEHKKSKIGNLQQRKFRQVIKRKKQEFHKESEEVSPSYYQESHEDHGKEPLYALIVHVPGRMSSTEEDYENVDPKHKRTQQPAPGHETEYAVLRVASSPQPSYSFQDNEYELIMPIMHPAYPSHFSLMSSGNLNI